MDTGVRDLEVAFFKANSTWFQFDDKYSKDLSNRPIYAVWIVDNSPQRQSPDDSPPVSGQFAPSLWTIRSHFKSTCLCNRSLCIISVEAKWPKNKSFYDV